MPSASNGKRQGNNAKSTPSIGARSHGRSDHVRAEAAAFQPSTGGIGNATKRRIAMRQQALKTIKLAIASMKTASLLRSPKALGKDPTKQAMAPAQP